MAIDSVLVNRAQQVASARARASGVQVRELRTEEAPEACELLAQIWAPGAGRVPLEASLLIALVHSENYVAGAFQDGTLVGVCVGFFAAPTESGLHSHIAGVRGARTGRGIGAALKLHQRAWALRRSVATISWTYDPLVARNAYFNLERLGAHAVDYIPDFYGEMSDGLNDGQGSDRVVARWDLAVWPPRRTKHPPGLPALELGEAREPVRIALPPSATTCRVAVPDDIVTLRVHDPELAAAWRAMTRAVFTELTHDGWSITGFDRSGFYRLERSRACG
ncbi:hypothetical protein [Flexivirga caeni]|uniref:N-acetyltransferase domain-containing protein n=1 Tax=Flexivirga caeni TaxID=2294115 RepID=A0A3M9M672_9MICO|nr:hypothetical protein [Flexivirga caeni]RNI21069.1 hypothetical protein EFY87_12345 [Flexivirga caeni]